MSSSTSSTLSSPVASSLQNMEALEKEDEAMHNELDSIGERRKKADTKHASTITESTVIIVNNKIMVAGLVLVLFIFVALFLFVAAIFGFAVLGTIVVNQGNKLSQFEQKVNNQSGNYSSVVPYQLLEDLQHNNSVLRSQVSVLQANYILQEERLRVLENTGKEQSHEISPYGDQTEERFTLLENIVADQNNKILKIHNRTERVEEDFTLLDRRLTEEYRILNSSLVKIVLVVEKAQKTIATNTLQIETLNSTFIDTHDALRTDFNATIPEKELILAKLSLLETTVTEQELEILKIRNQTEKVEEKFTGLDRRLTEEYQMLNSSDVEIVSVVETVQKMIATNTLQIETLNSTFIDTHDVLRADLNATLTRTELILSQLSSVNRSLEQQKEDTEELRIESRRNISAVIENTHTLINDVRSEVMANNETIGGLNTKIDRLETTQSEIQVQQGREIKDLKRNVSDINFDSGLAISGVVMGVVAIVLVIMTWSVACCIIYC